MPSFLLLFALLLTFYTHFAGGVALLTLIALQPYSVFDLELLFRAESTDDLGFSLQVARDEILRI